MMPDAGLTVRRTIPAPPDEVYRAWTEPAVLIQWFGPPGHGLATAEMDVRVGGQYRFGMRALPDGEVAYVRGEYRELAPPARLVFTWSWEESGKSEARDTVVTVHFREVPTGTEVVLTHELLPNQKEYESHEQGWRGVLLKLEERFART
jgi:uncharacterized protein YndB with AHSA1/START domain